MTTGFTIKTTKVKNGDFTYRTHRLTGWLDGRRIREQFKNQEEAEGRKNELEVKAANGSGNVRARVTRLSTEQLAEAESAFARLAGRPLSQAVSWYLETYRPPETATAIGTAIADFLADRGQHVRSVVLTDYRRDLEKLRAAFPTKCVHEISTADIQQFLGNRGFGKKRFNNFRGTLAAFFSWCKSPLRGWTRENPVAPVQAFKITRGLPEIISVTTAQQLMEYLESYTGDGRDLPAGCMVPYFALCLFAGIRPCPLRGEISKMAKLSDLGKAIDLSLNAIRISPEISKVKAVRQIAIRPNLAAWLMRYPTKQFPILPLGYRKMIQEIRVKFGIGDDVLRHTFISMHVAKFKSMGEAALEAGNSETMIRKHYYNVVSGADAESFWSIAPGVTTGEIVALTG